MRKTLLLFVALLFCVSVNCFAQKIEENKTDDFTNKSVKRTSWETLFTTMDANCYFRISKVGDDETFDLKYQDGSVFSIDKDQQLLLKLDNGNVITLANLQYSITCIGCGAKGMNGSRAQGIEVAYPITKDQATTLKTAKIVKVRITTTAGYFDDEVKDKNAGKVAAALNLL